MTGSDVAALRIPVNGVELAVQVVGSGPPIVLVHGSLDDHRAWERIVRALAGSHMVVTYDRRGHGGSSCPPGQGRISEDVEDLAGVLCALKLNAPLVVGHSYGSCVTMLLGAHHPGSPAACWCTSPRCSSSCAMTLRPDTWQRRRASICAAPPISSPREQSQRASVTSSITPRSGAGHGTRCSHRRSGGPALRTPTPGSTSRETLTRLAVRPELLAGYVHPLVVSHGDASLLTYGQIATLIVAALPRSRLHVVRGAGHAPHLSHPANFAELVLACAQETGRTSRFHATAE